MKSKGKKAVPGNLDYNQRGRSKKEERNNLEIKKNS